MIKSKGGRALMSYWISSKSFWAMITLLVFWFICSSRWTGNTCFTVPKRFVRWTWAFIVKEDLTSRTLTCLGGWIDFSWGGTVTFTWLSANTVFSAFRTFFALLWDWIKELSCWRVTFHTIGSNFIITFTAF